MTKYNSLSEYIHDVFFKAKTYEEAMKEFNAEIIKIKKYINLPIGLYSLKTLISVIREQIEKHREAYPNRTRIMLEQENILNSLLEEIEQKIINIEEENKK